MKCVCDKVTATEAARTSAEKCIKHHNMKFSVISFLIIFCHVLLFPFIFILLRLLSFYIIYFTTYYYDDLGIKRDHGLYANRALSSSKHLIRDGSLLWFCFVPKKRRRSNYPIFILFNFWVWIA